MTEEQLAQIEAGAVRLPIGAKDRKGVDICLGDSVHFADAAEWGSTETPMWTVRMEGGKLPQPGSPSDLARFCEVVETDGIDPAAIVAEIRRLQADNAALRARAVPALEWKPVEDRFWCTAGDMVFNVQKAGSDGFFWRWFIYNQRDEDLISIRQCSWKKLCNSPEQAKSACEAAFLQLVGVKS